MYISNTRTLSLIVVLLINIFSSAAFAAEPELSIALRSTVLRKSPQAWAAHVSELSYGTSVKKIEDAGGWIKVSTESGKTGYILASAVNEKKSALSNSMLSMMTAPQESDIALAGKGFGAETEEQFRKNTPGANFAALDKIERDRVSEKELRQFAAEGKLS
jgi:uncharacterized protein YgiM (DUF1202 family)